MIQISEDIRIRKLDKLNLVLEQRMQNKSKKTKELTYRWIILGYFSDLKAIIKRLYENHLYDIVKVDKQITTLLDVLQELSRIEAVISNIGEELDKKLKELK